MKQVRICSKIFINTQRGTASKHHSKCCDICSRNMVHGYVCDNYFRVLTFSTIQNVCMLTLHAPLCCRDDPVHMVYRSPHIHLNGNGEVLYSECSLCIYIYTIVLYTMTVHVATHVFLYLLLIGLQIVKLRWSPHYEGPLQIPEVYTYVTFLLYFIRFLFLCISYTHI